MATRWPTTFAVALLTTKLSHWAVEQTLKLRLSPTLGRVIAVAALRLWLNSTVRGVRESSRSRALSRAWKAAAGLTVRVVREKARVIGMTDATDGELPRRS